MGDPHSLFSAPTAQAMRDPRGTHFFLGECFCLGVTPGLFHEDGLAMGLSGYFGSLLIPLEISVENRFLEIVGLESGSGLILGDFVPFS
jgi:hypothetical protein